MEHEKIDEQPQVLDFCRENFGKLGNNQKVLLSKIEILDRKVKRLTYIVVALILAMKLILPNEIMDFLNFLKEFL